MAPSGEVRRDQPARPPPPPAAPMAPSPVHQVEQVGRGLNAMHLHQNADPFARGPSLYPQQLHAGGGHNPASNRPQGGVSRSQSFSVPLKPKKSGTGPLRMYEFVKFQYSGRKPGWEIAQRTLLEQKTQDELASRIKKPSKDKKTGRSNAREIDSDDLVGKKGHKRDQILQLISDLNADDLSSEWDHKLIEMLEKVHDPDTGKLNCDKMIVIVKRKQRQSYIFPPRRVFNVAKAIVDVGVFQQDRQENRVYAHHNGVQQIPQVNRNKQAAGPPQHAGPSQHAGLPKAAAGQFKPAGQSQRAGPSHHDGPSYHQDSHAGNGARVGPAHKAQGRLDHEDDYDDIELDIDDDFAQSDRGGKANKAEKDKKYKNDNKQKGGRSDKKEKNTWSDKEDKKGKKKQRAPSIVEVKHRKADSSDSDSSSSSDKTSDAGTYRTASTNYSFGSPPDTPSFNKFFGLKGKKGDDQKHAPEASREHYRKNPIEYLHEGPRRYAKDDVLVEPASRSRRLSSAYGRPPSFHRDRPSRPLSVDLDEHFRKYDTSPDGRRLVLSERPRRDSIDLERKLVKENLLLTQELREVREKYERPPLYDTRGPRYDDRRRQYDERMPRYDDRRSSWDDDRRSFRY